MFWTNKAEVPFNHGYAIPNTVGRFHCVIHSVFNFWPVFSQRGQISGGQAKGSSQSQGMVCVLVVLVGVCASFETRENNGRLQWRLESNTRSIRSSTCIAECWMKSKKPPTSRRHWTDFGQNHHFGRRIWRLFESDKSVEADSQIAARPFWAIVTVVHMNDTNRSFWLWLLIARLI